MDQQKFLGLLDMLDGGGAGRSGETFEGGPLSGFLNALGIRPQGYQERMEQERMMPALLPRPMAAAQPNPMQGMSNEELMAMVEAAIKNAQTANAPIKTTSLLPYGSAPSVMGYGPR
jgi:hypothetical protein